LDRTMEMTNTPVEGTGEPAEQATVDIKSLLDSENTTTENVDADTGTEEVQNTDEAEFEVDEEQSDEDSESVDDEADEDSEAEETETVESNTFKDDELVTIDGEQISFGELKKQRMLHADYTRKRQQESAELKQYMSRYQVQQVEMADMRVAVANDVSQLKQRIAAVIDFDDLAPPDMALYEVDPYEFGRKKIDWERKQAAVYELHQAEQLLAQQNSRWVAEEFKLKQAEALESFSTKYPEFADPATQREKLSELGSFLVDNGFSADEVEGLADSRMMDMVYRLFKHEIVAQQVPQVVKQLEARAKAAKPGASTAKSPKKSSVDINMRKYRETGSSEYSTAVFKDLLDSE
jgi:hypothetical protein